MILPYVRCMNDTDRYLRDLSPELAQFVQAAIECGAYTNTDEVMREALRDWKAKRFVEFHETDALRDAWDEGINSGAGRYKNMEAIKRAARNA